MYIKTFPNISRRDLKLVGGKGAALGELTQAGFLVPEGFVITTAAYQQFASSELPVDVVEQIYRAFDQLGGERVAVRSSATVEDSTTASWAGQLESYLNTTRDNLIENIRKCWSSIKSERALAYAAQQDLNEDSLVVAVVVQKMVNSEAAGVMFTVNPITKDTTELMIEASWGLGEALVQGLITPDNFLVDRSSLHIVAKDIRSQPTMLVYREGENQQINIPAEQGARPALTDQQVAELAKLGLAIEKYFQLPQDIEWALEKGKLYILQSRPITTL